MDAQMYELTDSRTRAVFWHARLKSLHYTKQ